MVRLNPLNVVFYPSLLNERGIVLRRQLGRAIVTFLSALILALAIGGIAKLYQQVAHLR